MNPSLPLGLKPDSELAADPTFIALLLNLQAENLERVVKRVAREKLISIGEAVSFKNRFLRFFALAAHCRLALAPDHQTDAFWHEFILFTAEYMDFCQRHIGHYFHHQPFDDSTPADQISASVDARLLLDRHFQAGPDAPALPPSPPALACASGG